MDPEDRDSISRIEDSSKERSCNGESSQEYNILQDDKERKRTSTRPQGSR